MLIAEEKRKTNIAEYILYMWQVEDLIRAHHFDMDLIDKSLISQYSQSSRVKNEIRDWYANLMVMMHSEGIREKGHLSFLKTLVDQMNDLHLRLMADPGERVYHELNFLAADNLKAFRKRQPGQNSNDIETCMNALYGLLLLRLKKQPISRETEIAMSSFSKLLSVLSHRFLQVERGEREL